MQSHLAPPCVPTECRSAWQQLSPILPTRRDSDLLRACLDTGDEAGGSWRAWCASVGGRDELPRGGGAGMLPLLYLARKDHRIECEPTATRRLRDAYVAALVRRRAYDDICRELVAALTAKSIESLVLKGAALGHTVYPAPETRLAGDIDLLLRESDLGPAAECLLSAGWRWKELPMDFGRHHIAPLCHPSGLPVELHRRLFPAYYQLATEDLWARSRPLDLGHTQSRMLSAEDTLMHVCVHAAYCPTRASFNWVADAWFILRTRQMFDWPRLVDIAVSGRLSLPLAVTLSYLVDSLKAPVPMAALDRLWEAAARTDAAGRSCSQFGVMSAERRGVVPTMGGTGNLLVREGRLLRHAFPSAAEIRLAHGVEGPLLGYYLHRFRRFATKTPRKLFRLRPWADKAVKKILQRSRWTGLF